MAAHLHVRSRIAWVRLIDWFLQLSREQQEVFWTQLRKYERKNKMPYMTSVERMGMEKGLERGRAEGREKGLAEGHVKGLSEGHEKGLAEGLEKGVEAGHARGVKDSIRTVLAARFGEGCLEQLDGLEDVSDPSQLSSLTLAAATAATFEDFLTALSSL